MALKNRVPKKLPVTLKRTVTATERLSSWTAPTAGKNIDMGASVKMSL